MNKTIIFISDKNSYFFPYVTDENISIHNIWDISKKETYSFWIKVCRKLKIPTSFFFDKWKKSIKQYDNVIIFDGCYDNLLETYLNKKLKHAKKSIFC